MALTEIATDVQLYPQEEIRVDKIFDKLVIFRNGEPQNAVYTSVNFTPVIATRGETGYRVYPVEFFSENDRRMLVDYQAQEQKREMIRRSTFTE